MGKKYITQKVNSGFIKTLKKIYDFLKVNISYFLHYSKEQKIYKKLNSLTEQKINYKNKGSYIIDGHFYNFGYFFRLQLMRKATESYNGKEVGFVYKYNQKKCNSFLKNIGISKIEKLSNTFSSDILYQSQKIFKKIRKAEDILEIKFPYNAPAHQFYDYILKKQMLGKVDVKDENIIFYISEFIESIRFAERLLEEYEPNKIFMSHGINIQCSPLCYLAPLHNIEVITLFGNYGVPRFIRIKNIKDINLGYDTPLKKDLDKLRPRQTELLFEVGQEYLQKRLLGKTNDMGGQLAYDNELEDIKDFINKSINKPIIVIYAHCWFDHPHTFGMDRFRDFEDWILTTYKTILNNTNFVWLFRPHPGEDWYGGITLKDILPKELPNHIFILPKKLSGKSVMNIASGLITYHGTAGIEYASCGKPVMVADRGWYDNGGFTVNPKSRSEYINLLSQNWLSKVDQEIISRNAKIFAGIYFCCPKWQKNLLMPHDVYKEEVRNIILRSLDSKSQFISDEIQNIKKWLASDYLGYHTFNMINSDEYSLSNTI